MSAAVTETKRCSTSPSECCDGSSAEKRDGLSVYACARLPTSPSSVAEKSIVWRFAGRRRRIFSTCGLKPMSSIRSASSRTRIRIALERDEPPVREVGEAAGRRDDDVRALELLRLRRDRRAAVGGCAADPERRAEQRELLGHLQRELARRDEDERRGRLLVGRDALDERQPEGERLARARRRLAEDVAAGERVGDDEGLDAERLGDAAGGERVLDFRAHAERREKLSDMWCSTPFGAGFENQELESLEEREPESHGTTRCRP